MTPSNGPPRSPNMLNDNCNTVWPTYSHKNENAIVIRPNTAAICDDYNKGLSKVSIA